MKSNALIKYYKHNQKYKANLPKNVLANAYGPWGKIKLSGTRK